MAMQIKNHIEARVNQEYPDAEFGGHAGAIPQHIQDMLEAGDTSATAETGFDMKQATMPDMATSGADIFQGIRPTLVVEESSTHGTFSKEVVTESTMADKTSVLELSTSNSFENQFISQYNCRVFPWALYYDCGGPDYPELFGDWAWLEKQIGHAGSSDETCVLRDRWRRIQGRILGPRPQHLLAR